MKIQLDFDARAKQQLDSLVSRTECKTYKELFNNALTILMWAIKQREEGRHIASVDEDNKTYRELIMPAIEAAAENAAISLDRLEARSSSQQEEELVTR